MNLKTIITAVTVSLHCTCFICYSQLNENAKDVAQQINPNAIKADMTFLADDITEGRLPGSKGFEIASKYVESQFISMGLEPGGEHGAFHQQVMLNRSVVVQEQTHAILFHRSGSIPLAYDEDFILSPTTGTQHVKAPLIFVGYGISAPDLGYDDYGKTDVTGKIVVYFNQAPTHFPSNERAYFSSAKVKQSEAAKRGAVGVLSMQLPNDQRTSWNALTLRAKQGSYQWIDSRNGVQGVHSLAALITFNPEKAEMLFARSGKSFLKTVENLLSNKSRSFALNLEMEVNLTATSNQIRSSNLIGIIPGSDPSLRNEYVVYAAHLDHFGIQTPVAGDSIYNGAHDNASGTALILEIARSFKRLRQPPLRSILIAVVTGEEMGLLGSDYFVTHPTVPSGSIVANLSIDMPFFFHPVLDIVPYGAQHSSLAKPLGEVCDFLDLEIAPDPFPEQVIFIRSDHFSFVQKGIPALFIKSGFKTVSSDSVDRSVSDVAWRRTTYHKPNDDMTQAFDFNAAATHAKLNFLTGYLVANDPARPTWNKGDFFGAKFGQGSMEE